VISRLLLALCIAIDLAPSVCPSLGVQVHALPLVLQQMRSILDHLEVQFSCYTASQQDGRVNPGWKASKRAQLGCLSVL
jgi:hypothetical protein